MRSDHLWKAENFYCRNPLKVPPFLGMVLEMGGACSLRVLQLKLTTTFPRGQALLIPLFWAALVRVGMRFTGFYMNPVLAISQTIRCVPAWQLALVYVLGPFLGSLIGGRLYYNYLHIPPPPPPPLIPSAPSGVSAKLLTPSGEAAH